MRGRVYRVLLATLMLVILVPAAAQASVTYSDWRLSTTTVFVKSGDEFTQVSTGGYSDSSTLWICYPANGWSYAHLGSTDESGAWKAYGKTNFYFGEWQAYITSSGTSTRARYSVTSGVTINQYAYHGFTSILKNGYYTTSAGLSDYHDGYNWSSGQKVAWDAVRFYY